MVRSSVRFIFMSIASFVFVMQGAAQAENIYSNFDGVDFGYRYMDARHYDSNKITLNGSHEHNEHNFSYKFSHDWGTKEYDSLTVLGAGYAYKGGPHWLGLGVSSSSDEPYSQFNLVDFYAFYAFRVFQHTLRYTDGANGSQTAHYNRLYLGVDWTTERLLLDGYPLPVIRYEYDDASFFMILGFPLTYVKLWTASNQYLELKYAPIMNAMLSYSVEINKANKISLQAEIEQKQYRIKDLDKDRYYHSQLKYYTEYYWLRIKYTARLTAQASISPFAAFLLDGKRYYGKSVSDKKHEMSTGVGIALGVNLSLNF